MNSVKEAWESFEAAVIPEDAPAVQRSEMRRAFYAGAWAMLMGCSSIGETSVTEEEGVAMLESWKKECERFYLMMNMGRA